MKIRNRSLHFLKYFALIYYLSQIAPSTKVATNSLQVVTIALARFGTLTQAKNSSHLMNTAMSYIVWHSTIHLGKYSSIYRFISDKIVTGSFDKKAKIWDANTG